uniref:Glycosyltransferase n=1 Tax=viral metagenome TaxID=1070528 RepID=A0A6C0CTW6_9ZZZZ
MVGFIKKLKRFFCDDPKASNKNHPVRSYISSHPSRESFQTSYLYVVLPYFNYCKYKSRTKLFLEFIKRIQSNRTIRIIIVEGTPKGMPFDLPTFSDKIFLHIKVELSDRIWIKENLINLAIKNLPKEWYYVAWIDADLTFLNEHWIDETIKQLKQDDIVQLFDSAMNLGPNGETLKIDKGFVYQYLKSGHEYIKTYKYGFWHPGYAWACNRFAYEKMGKLIDFGILGSGDHHMALAWIGKVECSHPGNIHLDYMIALKDFQDRCKNIKLGYIPGTILHHYHGSIADRRYQERWQILTKNQYSPIKDIAYKENGLLYLTEKGKRFQEPIDDYFRGRREDQV